MVEEKKQAKKIGKKKKPAGKPKKETPPKEAGGCGDINCPIHGTLSMRGVAFDGVVVSDKMKWTVIVLREYLVRSNKYERYLRSRSRIPAHNPPCINARTGDKVKIMECRRLSKTVSFVVVGKQNG